MVEREGLVKWFSELSHKDVNIAGGKGASLAEMYNHKFPIPPGFIVTARAYSFFIEKSGLKDSISSILSSFDVDDTTKLEASTKKIRELIDNAKMPPELEEEIKEAYDVLDVNKRSIAGAKSGALEILKNSHEPPFVAVRSSATAEDLADASFAGQQESFLNVKGAKDLIQKVKECFASLFTARATYYRVKKGFKHETTQLAVVVQKMIDSDKSGVMFSQNPIKNDKTIMIEGVWGLGEGIVSGRIKPDTYIISGNLENFDILDSKISEKKVAIVRSSSGKDEIVKLTPERSRQQVLTPHELKILARYGRQLEQHYEKPQDIEFAIEGSEIYIVQSRPITTKALSESEKGEIEGESLLSGLGASPGISSGTVKIVHNIADLSKVKKGDVLVTEMTNPDMVVTMQRASGIVTDEGGITSHAAIVSREMGIPAVVGTGSATKTLKDGMIITVDGNAGRVFEGKRETKLSEVKPIVETKTKIKVIVDLPDFAERAALSGAKAVGLTRLEGIIATSGKHPVFFVKQKRIKDYIQILFEGLKRIAKPFDEIWVRSSDIRSDEFRNLEGSSEEVEGNPMLGNHGIRFSLKHPDIMRAELTAIKEVADEYPHKHIGLMFPQVISVAEVKGAKKIAREVGMPKNTKIGVMVETPAAVQIIEDLCKEGIDFVSFGTNDLTQYTLAIDRNNEDVQYIYDEMNPAVLNSISSVIRVCKRYGVETSICGQAGSKEEMVRFLIKEGINSISVNADAAEKISNVIAKVENSELVDGEGEIKEEKPEEKILDALMQERSEHPVAPKEEEGESEEVSVEQAEESEEEEEIGSDEEGSVENRDIEDVILSQLENGEEKDSGESGERVLNYDVQANAEHAEKRDYNPGNADSNEEKEEIPSLNDSIPVDSRHFNQEDDLKEEWEPAKEDTKLDIF